MTSQVKKATVSLRRKTPTKTWKDNLRTACLNRARESRRKAKRDDVVSSATSQPARLLVQEEMMHRNISLLSPCLNPRDASWENELSPMETEEQNRPSAGHYLSEDELFQLLAEVEAEIEKEDTHQVEEVLYFERGGILELEERIADFEHWQQESRSMAGGEHVICPTCSESNLIVDSAGRVICANRMDGSCSFALENRQQLSLGNIKDRLAGVFEHHARNCRGRLAFSTRRSFATVNVDAYGDSLFASCSSCGMAVDVV